MISFMSEHTAEYALVNDIVSRLSSAFPETVPMYLWLNREGNSMGQRTLKGRAVKLTAVFARRPKVTSPGDDHILVKFNSSILHHAFLARSFGIPVLAGVPLISDLSRFSIKAKCAWFILDGSRTDKGDLEILLSSGGEVTNHFGPLNVMRGPSSTSEIIREINGLAIEGSWNSWLAVIREIRSQLREQHYFGFLQTYKPFYLVML